MTENPWKERVVIVTGASSGIGLALSRQVAGQGGTVVLAARREQKLQEAADNCRKLGGQALAIAADVAVRDDCRRLIEQTMERYGRIDCLINNAGYAVTSELLKLKDLDIFDHQMQVNFNGSMYCTYYALPHLIETGGRIGAISSIAGWFSMAGSSIYNASKFAMRGFFDALRQELHDSGVSVTCIYPGYVVTEFMSRVQQEDGSERGKDALSFYTDTMMTADTCARITLRALNRRKRDVLMTAQANIGIWIKRLFPGLVDRLLINYRNKRNEKLKGSGND